MIEELGNKSLDESQVSIKMSDANLRYSFFLETEAKRKTSTDSSVC